MPAPSRHRSTIAGVAVTFTPSASNRSALPHRLEALRLPCFATRTPHAASTRAATVDTLNVWAPSPPVPQASNAASTDPDRFPARPLLLLPRPTISPPPSPLSH